MAKITSCPRILLFKPGMNIRISLVVEAEGFLQKR